MFMVGLSCCFYCFVFFLVLCPCLITSTTAMWTVHKTTQTSLLIRCVLPWLATWKLVVYMCSSSYKHSLHMAHTHHINSTPHSHTHHPSHILLATPPHTHTHIHTCHSLQRFRSAVNLLQRVPSEHARPSLIVNLRSDEEGYSFMLCPNDGEHTHTHTHTHTQLS